MKLLLSGIVKFIMGILLVGVLLFLPAGTINYGGGILFTALLFIPIFILGVVLFVKSPDLLRKRLDHKEKESTQKGVVALSALVFLGGFVVSGLDFRFSWSGVPLFVTIVASVMFLLSYVLYAEVMRENAYLSRTVKVEEGQQVVSTGLYGVVRHPMYMATVLMFMMIPLILGSLYALIIFGVYPFIIALRIKDEERLLEAELKGYKEYKEKVKYRMIPFIW